MIDSATGLSTNIEHKECSESHKTLGKLENPSGNYDDVAARIKDKADVFGHRVNPVCHIPKHTDIHQHVHTISLLWFFVRHTIHRPSRESTIALHIRPTPQIGNQTSRDIAKTHQDPIRTRKRSHIPLLWAQKISGLSVPILVNTTPRLPHLSDERWVLTMRLFLEKSNLSVHLTEIRPSALPRENDRCIMDVVIHSKDFTQHSIILINRCRIHLRAVFVSDLADASGKVLTNNAISCYGHCNKNRRTKSHGRSSYGRYALDSPAYSTNHSADGSRPRVRENG